MPTAKIRISPLTVPCQNVDTSESCSPFWTMPTEFLRGPAAAGGIALVNSIAAIGGFAGPFLIGFVRDTTGGFGAGLLTLAGVLICGAAIAVLLRQNRHA